MKPAIVKHPTKGFLRLEGVFEYPRWSPSMEAATVMGAAKASQWASVYGGASLPVVTSGATIVDEKPPSTKPGAPGGSLFGGIPGLGGY